MTEEQKPDVQDPGGSGRRARFYSVIFQADTRAGQLFDLLLIVAILMSVAVVMLQSMASVAARHGTGLLWAGRFFTVLFAVEYGLRLWCVKRPQSYARSFFGVVDLLAVLPGVLELVLPGSRALSVIRVLRVLRVFRVLGLGAYVGEAQALAEALIASRRKIVVFLLAVFVLTIILGSAMYVIESNHPEGRTEFSSIPRSVYWAIVTLTTVGYGDISPHTGLGQALAAVIMVLGYAIIVVPTGLVSVELARSASQPRSGSDTVGQALSSAVASGAERDGAKEERACPSCSQTGHDADARFCKYCGERVVV